MKSGIVMTMAGVACALALVAAPADDLREQQLLAGCSAEQRQQLEQAAAAFAASPDNAVAPAQALARALEANAVAGLDPADAGFLVMSAASRKLDEDVRLVQAELAKLNLSGQKLQRWIEKFSQRTGMVPAEDGSDRPAPGGGPGGGPGGAPGAFGQAAGAITPLLTPHFRLEYWSFALPQKVAPGSLAAPERNVQAMKLRMALAGLQGAVNRTNALLQQMAERRTRFLAERENFRNRAGPARDQE